MLIVAQPLIIAHRGASAELPENTLVAFRRALALGVDGIELDVRLTRDGVPVVFHDASLRRLTGVPGRLADLTWRALAALRVGGAEPIPRLTTVLRLVGNRALVQIEIKAGVDVGPVIEAIRKAHALRRVIIASFDAGIVCEARRLAPSVRRMLISEGRLTPANLIRQLKRCGAAGLSVNHHAVVSAGWIRSLQKQGYPVWVWTVNDGRRARRLASWGIDALLSDDPALLQREL